MFKLVSLGFLIWSFFSPLNASIAFISLFILLEGYFLFLDITKSPDLQSIKERYYLTEAELRIFNKYYVFYRFPTTSAKTSETMSGFQFAAFIWVPWLLYNRLWVPAIVIGLNFFLANYLSRKLKPLHFAHFAKQREIIFCEKEDIKSVYDKVASGKAISNEKTSNETENTNRRIEINEEDDKMKDNKNENKSIVAVQNVGLV